MGKAEHENGQMMRIREITVNSYFLVMNWDEYLEFIFLVLFHFIPFIIWWAEFFTLLLDYST